MRKITENTKLPFGKHRGIKLRDVPDGYLDWCQEKLRNGDFHEWAVATEEEIRRRKNENSSVQNLEEQANQLLRDAGFDPNNL
jgi:hypothetical protein